MQTYSSVVKQWLPIIFCVVVLLFSARGNAQSAGTGSIQGAVADSTGAFIQNASVILTNAATQVKRTAVTGTTGLYSFPNVDIGTYTVEVTAQGFEQYTRTNVVLEVGSSISVNVEMTVGRTDQKVEVQASGLALQTEDVTFKQTIDQNATVRDAAQWPADDKPDHALRRLHVRAGWRLYRQQIFLSDHLRLDRWRRRQHDDVAGWTAATTTTTWRTATFHSHSLMRSANSALSHGSGRAEWEALGRHGQRGHTSGTNTVSRLGF